MVLGIEIGGTKLQVGVCDRQGRLRRLERRSVERRGGAAGIRKQLQMVIPPLLKQYQIHAIGVGFGGPVDAQTGRVVKSHQIAGWSGFPLRQWFVRQFGLPAVIENDSNCAALAEATCGAGRGQRVVFYMNIGTGIGGGLVIGGQLYQGRSGAMEIGHMRWPRGNGRAGRIRKSICPTVEELASGLAIERGRSTLAKSAHVMGVAVANTVTLLNPDIVIVGGGVAQAGERFFAPLRETAAWLVFEPFRKNHRLVPSALGEIVVVVGAALLAAQGLGCRCKSKRTG